MRIVVRNNDPMKAFKLLNRKLYEDNTFTDLKERQFFKSKGEKKREQKKRAVARQRKEQAAKKAIFDKLENQVIRGQNDRSKYKRNPAPVRG
jgi:ribosomal protein S21